MADTEDLEISVLILLEKNPRKISKDQVKNLCKSIQEDPNFLRNRPILLNKTPDGKLYVYAGNQRVRAAQMLGWKTIPCIVDYNLPEDIIRKRIIKDNKTYGEFDFDMLANEWEIDDLLDSGFTPEELVGFDGDVETVASEEDEETLEPVKDEEAITKLGDTYELDGHIVICDDSTIPDRIVVHLETLQPILMVTDPPYGVNYDPVWREKAGKGVKSKGTVKNDDKVDWSIAYSIFTGSIVYTWCASWFLPEVAENLKNCGFEIKSLIIWAKQQFALSRSDYHWQHEPCWYAVRKGCNHNWKSDRKQTTLWEIANLNCFGKSQEEDERTSHSTQKPLECMARPIRNHTDPGDYVYDPFLGSGTTLIAAEKLQRKCIGVEISPAYVDVIVNRWIKWRKKNGLEHNFIRNGKRLQELSDD